MSGGVVNVTIIDDLGKLRRVCDAIGRAGWVYAHEIVNGQIDDALAVKKMVYSISPREVIRCVARRCEKKPIASGTGAPAAEWLNSYVEKRFKF